MTSRTIWQALAIVWALASFSSGGLGLLVGVTTRPVPVPPAPQMARRRVIANCILLVLSGIVALAWVIDPAHVVEQTWQGVLAIGVWMGALVALYKVLAPLTRGGRGRMFLLTWWPRLRIPLRLLLAAATLLGLESERDPSARNGLMLFLGLQMFLVVWELWLRWYYRDR